MRPRRFCPRSEPSSELLPWRHADMASSLESRSPDPGSPAPDAAAQGAAIQVLNQIALGYILSAALNVALELRIADRLADGPRAVGDLAEGAGVSEGGVCACL